MQEQFDNWIGRQVTRHDVLTPRLAEQFRATLFPTLWDVDVPPGLHWCLAVAAPGANETGPDGAEAKGIFLPPVELPRRMWAGGEVQHLAPLRIGAAVERVSTITGIRWRQGTTGPLCIVSVTHEISCDSQPAVRERHDILFRDGAMGVAAPKAQAELPAADLAWKVDATPLLLFRFSALTFNGHRIHYDLPYAREVEGYDGLLVHGPLQATLALNAVAALRGVMPRRFTYRCVSPLTAGQTIHVQAAQQGEGTQAHVLDDKGTITLVADAN